MSKTKNLGDPYTHRITLRLTDKQMEFLENVSNIMGISPSDYIRMSINMGAVSMKNKLDIMVNGDLGMDIMEVGTSNENVKTNSNDKL